MQNTHKHEHNISVEMIDHFIEKIDWMIQDLDEGIQLG